ncbi:MAG: hypothetical protein SLRJCFUN_001139 [Candidatus Fervidibacter sp.]
MRRWSVVMGCLVGLLGVSWSLAKEPVGVLVEVKGSVQVRRHQSRQWLPAQINLPLYPGDTVRVGHESLAVLWFADGTMRRLKAGSRWTVPQPPAPRPSMWQELWASLRQRFRLTSEQTLNTVAAARTLTLPLKGVTILFPRNSRILSDRPVLDWQPVPKAQGYRITIGLFDRNPPTWETVVERPPLRYPDDAPPLVPGKVYVWRVEAIGVAESDTAWFVVVPPAEARDLRFTLQRLRERVSHPDAYAAIAAEFLESRKCYSDAIRLIWQTVGRSPQNPAVQIALAQLYHLVGLSDEPAPLHPTSEP